MVPICYDCMDRPHAPPSHVEERGILVPNPARPAWEEAEAARIRSKREAA
jgi:hypothetical protein